MYFLSIAKSTQKRGGEGFFVDQEKSQQELKGEKEEEELKPEQGTVSRKVYRQVS